MKQDKDNDDFWSAVSRVEISVKNAQNDLKKLYLHSAKQEIAMDALQQEIQGIKHHLLRQDRESKVNQQENISRFDKIEDTLAIIVDHLKK